MYILASYITLYMCVDWSSPQIFTFRTFSTPVLFSPCRVKLICLHRGPRGLGFSIVGGKGSVHGDLPIYIKQVFNEGAAGQDGRLKKGDQLLAVNGISFENVTHKYAAETLKYLQGDVKLEVISND